MKHSALLSLAYATGMRRSEVLNLEPRHIDAERKVIKVVAGKDTNNVRSLYLIL
jgi:Phage integrase family.